ncbi:sulfur oxygenase reductase family protein, partial [Acidiplasma aeolicum]
VGSFQLKAKGIHETLESNGEVPKDQEGAFKPEEAVPTPPEYRVHMEWSSPEDAMFGIGRVLFAHPARELHDKVLDTLIRGPYIRLLNPMMEGTTWREYLNSP